MIFYLNLFKAIKFAFKVIDMNRQAPNRAWERIMT